MFESISTLLGREWVHTTLFVLYVVTIIGVIGVVVSENRNPVKTLAWVTVLLLLPGLGVLIYIVFGRSLRNTRMISRRNKRKLRRKESFRKVKIEKLGLSPESQQQIQLGRMMSSAIFYPCNRVEIFTNGHDKFEALLRDIGAATKYVNLQYYIFSDDCIGNKVKDALIAKAKEGVEVRIIYDSVGSFGTPARFFKEMESVGIQAFPFFKVAFPWVGTRLNWRNHRKICIIDGKIGYIGGMNVADRYIDGGKSFDSWRDTHLRIQGPAVGALQYSFAVDWNFMGRPLIEDCVVEDPGEGHDAEGVGMQLLTSGPTSQWTTMGMLFLKAIGNAKRRVFLQTPYFLPTDGMLKTLQAAALSGVDVRIMVPMRSDSSMLDNASNSYIMPCLQSGIKVYRYRAGMLHAKMLIVDDEFASVGSTNFDFRSFEHNFESNMQMYSKAVNQRLTEIFMRDLKNSERVEIEQWRHRPVLSRVKESVVRLLSPIL